MKIVKSLNWTFQLWYQLFHIIFYFTISGPVPESENRFEENPVKVEDTVEETVDKLEPANNSESFSSPVKIVRPNLERLESVTKFIEPDTTKVSRK